MQAPPKPQLAHLATPICPAWVDRWLGPDAETRRRSTARGWTVTVTDSPAICLVQVTAPRAIDLDAENFERLVTDVYTGLASELERHAASHPIRFWNFVPDMPRLEPDGTDRYMVFNAGRHRAFTRWYGEAFQSRLVASTAVDHHGGDLVVQVLAARQPGRAVENPVQYPAYQYSKRYGPIPPSFARATIVPRADDGDAILVAGTASVVGEDSRHFDDLDAQLAEVSANLASLLASAQSASGAPVLPIFAELRAYVPSPEDEPAVTAALLRTYPTLHRLEVMPAMLCRPGLLVEVEGLAVVETGGTRR